MPPILILRDSKIHALMIVEKYYILQQRSLKQFTYSQNIVAHPRILQYLLVLEKVVSLK